MPSVARALFLLNFAWLATHELDAIHNHEWRVFPITSALDDLSGYRLFTILHVPLFALIVWASPNREFQLIFDGFMVFHAGLHWLLQNHPKLEFRNWFSRLIIYGAVPLGLIHIALLLFG